MFYTKTNDYTFNRQFTPYTEKSAERKKNYHTRIKGDDVYVTSVDERGVGENDVWQIPLINSQARERMGYPTQKPVELLRKIITASSNPGDVVLDPFAGCGTTLVAAQEEGREWVGIDISPTAVNLMARRMIKATNGAVAPRLVGLPATEVQLRELKPFEFQNWVIQRINGTHSPRKTGDMGIDGLSFMYHEPIQVKQSRVDRTVVDEFETAVERSGKDIGYIVGFSFTRGAYEEAARAKAAGKGTIVLVRVRDLIEATEPLTRPARVESVHTPEPAEETVVEPVPRKEPTPDLMRLLTAWTGPVGERPLPFAPARKAKPSPEELVKSDKQPTSG